QIGKALRNMSDRQNVLVKFIGYTDDSPLSERDARIYGTREGLSKARARRVALAVQEALKLSTASIDSDGRGATRPLGSNATAHAVHRLHGQRTARTAHRADLRGRHRPLGRAGAPRDGDCRRAARRRRGPTRVRGPRLRAVGRRRERGLYSGPNVARGRASRL